MRLADILNTSPTRQHGDIKELKQSIADVGLINLLTVDQDGNLLAGRRRYQAVKELGWQDVDVRVIPTNGNPLLAFRVSIDENLKRKSLTDPEVASAIKEYDELKKSIEGQACGHGVTADTGWSYAKTADDLSISKPAVVKAIKIATIVEEHPDLAKFKKGQQILRQHKIIQQKEAITKLAPPTGLYNAIVVDPPWEMEGEYEPDGRRGIPPYPTMAVDKISQIKLPVADNCVLWLWATNKHLHDAFHILDVWGFQYKNILTWVKHNFGVGDWLRGQTEHCLLATRGKPIFLGHNKTTVLHAPKGHHSEKPDGFYKLVEETCGGKKLDYFSCKCRHGWDSFGDEVI